MSMTWTASSGVLSNGLLNKKIMMAAQPLMRFRSFVSIKEAFGKQKGETVNWDKVANVGTYGGKLTETNTMHQSSQAITQGTLTVDEYGNSIPYTGKIELLSEFDIEQIVKKGLMNDMVKCIDGEVERQFNSTPLRYVGTSASGGALTTNGTATTSNTSALNTYHVGIMLDELRKRNVPGFAKAEGDYVCIGSVEALRGIKDSLLSVWQYTDQGVNRIAAGEVGKFDNCRFILDTFATRFTYSSTARTATAKSWAQTSSLDAYFFGEDTVREAVAVPEEIRYKEVTDFGRSKGLAWYFLGGWQLEWSDATNARIIKWDSAG